MNFAKTAFALLTVATLSTASIPVKAQTDNATANVDTSSFDLPGNDQITDTLYLYNTVRPELKNYPEIAAHRLTICNAATGELVEASAVVSTYEGERSADGDFVGTVKRQDEIVTKIGKHAASPAIIAQQMEFAGITGDARDNLMKACKVRPLAHTR